MNSIEAIALQYAREEFGFMSNWTDQGIKSAVNRIHPGGWNMFYEETFRQVVA